MKSTIKNNAKTNEGIVKSGEFSYSRKARTIKAYGEEYQLPVKTIEFSDKLLAANDAIAKTTDARDTVSRIKSGIALFIGEDEANRIFPEDNFDNIDIDEILGFWLALNFELSRSQNELIARYSASRAMRV